MKYILSLITAIAVTFTACGGFQSHELKGTIKDASNLQVVLEQSFFDRSFVAIGKAACDANGNFTIEQKGPWPEGLYRLTIGAKKVFFMLNGKEEVIEIKGDLATIDRFDVEVKGSETYSCYVNVVKELIQNSKQMTGDLARQTVAKGCTPLMRAFLAIQLFSSAAGTYSAELMAATNELKAASPDSKYAKDMAALQLQFEQAQAKQASAELIQVGQPAPEISLPGPDGKTHALSSLKGKVVLLDFWASWCGPCRKSNPHVVEIYNKYKGKGFDVFSVSLDGADPRMKLAPAEMENRKTAGRSSWIAAIKQDNLTWENHVSDLQHWGSAPAAVYGVTSIPKTFLIGRDGKIVALNPRDNLEEMLLKTL